MGPMTSLQCLWKSRATLYAQHAYQEWMKYLDTIPVTTGVWNAFSLYEGMGGLVSVLWQLSLSLLVVDDDDDDDEDNNSNNDDNNNKEDDIIMTVLRTKIEQLIQMPLYSNGYNDSDVVVVDSVSSSKMRNQKEESELKLK